MFQKRFNRTIFRLEETIEMVIQTMSNMKQSVGSLENSIEKIEKNLEKVNETLNKLDKEKIKSYEQEITFENKKKDTGIKKNKNFRSLRANLKETKDKLLPSIEEHFSGVLQQDKTAFENSFQDLWSSASDISNDSQFYQIF